VPRLLVIQGVDEGRHFELKGAQIGIGRDAANPVHLHDTEVSRRHAEVRLSPDGSTYRLIDRGSSNGVYVNGQEIQDVLLRAGDQIQIGQTVLLYSAAPPSSDLAERIHVISRPPVTPAPLEHDPAMPSILHEVADTEGSRILTRPETAESNWLRTRLANLAILYEASQAVSHILDVGQLLERILELTFRSIEADRACILLRRSTDEVLESKAVRWRRKDHDESIHVSRTITDYVLRHRTGILVSDAAHDERFPAGQSIIRSGIREAICVPMKGRHETLGVLYLDTIVPGTRTGAPSPTKFTEDHLSLAIALAHQAALAVEDTRYYHALMQAERLAAVGQTIAGLSHHIKNILQGLKSGSEILGMGIRDKDDAMLDQGWKIVEKNQGRIFDLVMDMLTYSKEREPTLESVDLNAIVNEAVELVRGRAKELRAKLEIKPGAVPPLMADREGIHRAVLNLVSNALDAVADRPKPRVSVATMVDPDRQNALVSVSDNGAGIGPDQFDDLFKPFVSSKGSRGTGLGLAVSRKILREHGGDVTLESSPGIGSTFFLRLPIRGGLMGETATHAPIFPEGE
jgi:signal transduction histidine kinase